VYGIVFGAGAYYINRLINKGPEGELIEAGDKIKGPLGAENAV
jgi:hypothetical protein